MEGGGSTRQPHLSLEAEGKVSGKTLQKRHVSGCPSPAVAAGPRLPQWPQCSPRWSPLWCTARHHHSRHSTHRTWPSHGGPLRTTAPSGGLPHLGGVQESQGSRQSFKMGLGGECCLLQSGCPMRPSLTAAACAHITAHSCPSPSRRNDELGSQKEQ